MHKQLLGPKLPQPEQAQLPPSLPHPLGHCPGKPASLPAPQSPRGPVPGEGAPGPGPGQPAQFPNLKVRQGAFLSPVGPKWAPFVTGAEGPLIPGTQSTGLAKHEPLIHRKCFIDPYLWDKTLNLRSVQNDSVRRPPGL